MPEVFGRTNLHLPAVWLRLAVPQSPTDGWLDRLMTAALASKAPLDISSSPGLWGGALRGSDATLVCLGIDPARFSSQEIAFSQTQAHVIEILSAIGRPWLDFYVIRLTRAPEDYQLDGVLAALEEMRTDGLIRFLGAFCQGPPLAALGVLRFHDAFEALFLPSTGPEFEVLCTLAHERRVGVVVVAEGLDTQATCRLLTVRDADQIPRL